MSTNKERILLVDDSPTDIQFLIENLKDDFVLTVAKTGEKALELVKGETKPAAILMDVSMPGMDGYETCRKLKQNSETNAIEVIFVSALDSIEEKIRGYDAGGSDYVIKPVQPDELRQKLQVALKASKERVSYQAEAKTAMDTAMSAIMDAGEMGSVVGFFRASYAVTDLHQLAQLVVETCSGMGLSTSIQIHTPRENINFCSSGAMPQLEAELLSRLRSDVRIHQMGNRLIINYGLVSQLVRNLPEDEEKAGRLRDHLAIMLEGAADKCQSLVVQDEVKSLLIDSNAAMENTQHLQSDLKRNSMQIVDDLLEEVQSSFLSYGLTEEQELILMDIVKGAVDKSLELFEKGLEVDDQMENIINRIREISVLNQNT